jgi:Flp pilus assembly pilin Flp
LISEINRAIDLEKTRSAEFGGARVSVVFGLILAFMAGAIIAAFTTLSGQLSELFEVVGGNLTLQQ